MSSILSTSVCGVGTHTTSLPACPTFGSKGAVGAVVCAHAAVAASHTAMVSAPHRLTRFPVMTAFSDQEVEGALMRRFTIIVYGPGAAPAYTGGQKSSRIPICIWRAGLAAL